MKTAMIGIGVVLGISACAGVPTVGPDLDRVPRLSAASNTLSSLNCLDAGTTSSLPCGTVALNGAHSGGKTIHELTLTGPKDRLLTLNDTLSLTMLEDGQAKFDANGLLFSVKPLALKGQQLTFALQQRLDDGQGNIIAKYIQQ